MTKKHYEAIALIIANEARKWNASSKHAWQVSGIAGEMADYFQTDNKNFDRSKFMQKISDRIAE